MNSLLTEIEILKEKEEEEKVEEKMRKKTKEKNRARNSRATYEKESQCSNLNWRELKEKKTRCNKR